MKVTIKEVRNAVVELLGVKTKIGENNVRFSMYFGEYNTEIYVSLYNKYPGEEDAHEQNLEVTFIPLDANGDDLVFVNRSYADVLHLCNEVQRIVNWCSVLATEDGKGGTVISFGRSINTSLKDLVKAADGDIETEFGTAIVQIGEDFQTVVPVIMNFAAGKATIEHSKALLQDPPSDLVM